MGFGVGETSVPQRSGDSSWQTGAANATERVVQNGWRNSATWDRIQRGMSERQVVSILGRPTDRDVNIIDYVTLYYQGEIPGSGYVSGNVVVNDDDRVTQINRPVF